ncbi:hypothetical protein QFZ81_001832 [Paenibacillus sp. V4I9]|nr:hypothetical protein [Paenibacillus sp. V4I9]
MLILYSDYNTVKGLTGPIDGFIYIVSCSHTRSDYRSDYA